jgi:hypothetical protein
MIIAIPYFQKHGSWHQVKTASRGWSGFLRKKLYHPLAILLKSTTFAAQSQTILFSYEEELRDGVHFNSRFV